MVARMDPKSEPPVMTTTVPKPDPPPGDGSGSGDRREAAMLITLSVLLDLGIFEEDLAAETDAAAAVTEES